MLKVVHEVMLFRHRVINERKNAIGGVDRLQQNEQTISKQEQILRARLARFQVSFLAYLSVLSKRSLLLITRSFLLQNLFEQENTKINNFRKKVNKLREERMSIDGSYEDGLRN